MRTAALALACLLGASVTTAAAGEGAPAHIFPRFPGGLPPPPVEPPTIPLPDPRAYLPAHARAEAPRPPRGRICFSQAESRDKIAQRRLTDPFSATRAGRAEGEALRTRLCRWKQDELVYEVFVLRRDGRIVRLYIDAQNGQAVGAPDMAEHR